MKNLKTLSFQLGDKMLRMNSFTHKPDGEVVSTPIVLDEDKNTVTRHQTETQKDVIDLSKLLMYSYELEAPVVTQ